MGFSNDGYGFVGNQPIFREPFDIAGGGANLTRGTQEGVLFGNPATMPYGKRFHRWIGLKTAVHTTLESLQYFVPNDSNTEETVDNIFRNPAHFGLSLSLTYITNNFGITAFSHVEPDAQSKRFGRYGLPEVRLRNEYVSGFAGSYAATTGVDWLSFGLTAKYFNSSVTDLSVPVSDGESIRRATSPDAMLTATASGTAIGYDLGFLAFSQGETIDYRLALKIDDIGNTVFTDDSRDPIPQTLHIGTGLTIHDNINALHLALDYRDLLGAHDEQWFKKLYLGGKLTIQRFMGFAAGLYQGGPSMGMRLNFVVVQTGLTFYAKEMGEYPGQETRRVFIAYFSMGY